MVSMAQRFVVLVPLLVGGAATTIVDGYAGVHTCAFKEGALKCWGYGNTGALGTGSTLTIGSGQYGNNGKMSDLQVVDVGVGRTVMQASQGFIHTCAVLDNSNLKCWGAGKTWTSGDQNYGQLGSGSSGSANAIGDDPGEMGENLPIVDVGNGRTVKQVSGGDHHTCAVLDNDALKCWGSGLYGKLGSGSTDHIGDAPGEMGENLPIVDVGGGRTVKQVSPGFRHTCAVLDNGELKCWGFANNGRLGSGSTDNMGDDPGEMGENLPSVNVGAGRTVKQVVVGAESTCAMLDNDDLKCWGKAVDGHLGSGSKDDIGDDPGEMGENLPIVDVGGGRTVKHVSAGSSATCALLDNDELKCWGFGYFCALGSGSSDNIGDDPGEMGDNLRTVSLGAGKTVKQFASLSFHVCAVLDDNAVKCWGRGNNGQLGYDDASCIGCASYGEMGASLPSVDLGWPEPATSTTEATTEATSSTEQTTTAESTTMSGSTTMADPTATAESTTIAGSTTMADPTATAESSTTGPLQSENQVSTSTLNQDVGEFASTARRFPMTMIWVGVFALS